MNLEKPVTIKDIADRANVSISTVSRVLNNNPNVQSHIKELVLNTAAELGYEFKQQAEEPGPLKIGILVPDITNPFFTILLKGMTNIAFIHKAEILLMNADLSTDKEGFFIEQLIDRKVDGLIYIPFAEPTSQSVLELVADDFPVVFLDREIESADICSVMSDNEEGSYQASSYLLNLGHRKTLFIGGPEHFSTTKTRKAGFCRGLGEAGLQLEENLCVYGDTTFDSAFYSVSEALKRGVDFSAIFATNDLMALGAWNAVEAAGKRIPEDVSIIGYDDIHMASIMSLTTIAQPGFEIGRNAMMLLVDLILKKRTPPQRILLRDSLIIRKSCSRI